MQIMIANELTGEVIEFRSDLGKNSLGLNAIRGHIRQWLKNGMKHNQLNVLKYSDYRLWQYLREYAWQYMISECDVCNAPRKNSDLDWIDDSEGVCLMTICKHDSCLSPDVYEFFKKKKKKNVPRETY